MSITGLAPGDKVSYRKNIFSKWRNAVVVEVDTSLLIPVIVEDCETEQRVSVKPEQLV